MEMTLKQKVEEGVGDHFIQWYNKKMGRKFEFDRLGADPPDLLYRDEEEILPVEITTEYYDDKDARFQWTNMRNNRDAPKEWWGIDCDRTLMKNIKNRINQKCNGTQDPGTILVVGITSFATTDKEFQSILNTIRLPADIPFSGIYVGGRFPQSDDAQEGYYYWQII